MLYGGTSLFMIWQQRSSIAGLHYSAGYYITCTPKSWHINLTMSVWHQLLPSLAAMHSVVAALQAGSNR
jgi:hypothetical protein